MRYGIWLFLVACSTVQVGGGDSYLDKAKQAYEAGEKAFQDKAYEEAIKKFEEIHTHYPYSKYAALSDLRLADAYFAQDKLLEAADSYDFYIRFHPRHEKNAYASFQIVQSYYKAIPANFFLLPQNYVRDQTSTREALGAVERYLREYPTGEKVTEAEKIRISLLSQLADRDLSIARYYLKRGKKRGAVARFQYIVKQYPDTQAASVAKEQILRYASLDKQSGGDLDSTKEEIN